MSARARTISIASLVVLGLAVGVSTAGASVTIGQTGTPVAPCANNTDRLQPTVTSGNSYVVPPTVATGTIVSWSTEAIAGAGQRLGLKLYRSLGGATYQVAGQAGPHDLTGGVLNTFQASVPVQAGDILGTTVEPTGGGPGCNFPVIGETYLTRTGNLGIGASGDFLPGTPDRRQNISAVVNPANSFTLGKVKRNKKKGIAIITVAVPNPGDLALSGKGLKRVAKSAAGPGSVKLKVRAKGKKKRRLDDQGKVKIKANVSYTPTGGDLGRQSKQLRLKKNPS